MSVPRLLLKGMTWDHPRGYAPLERLSARYGERRGVDIAWDRRSLKDFGDSPVDVLARKYDLLVIDHPHVGISAEQGVLVPLDEWLDAAFLRK